MKLWQSLGNNFGLNWEIWLLWSHYFILRIASPTDGRVLLQLPDTKENRLFAAAICALVTSGMFASLGWEHDGIPYGYGEALYFYLGYTRDSPLVEIPQQVYDVVFSAGFSLLSE